jgi:hypothetical protein
MPPIDERDLNAFLTATAAYTRTVDAVLYGLTDVGVPEIAVAVVIGG